MVKGSISLINMEDCWVVLLFSFSSKTFADYWGCHVILLFEALKLIVEKLNTQIFNLLRFYW